MEHQTTRKRSYFRFLWIIPILLLIAAAIPKLIGVESMAAEAERLGMGHLFLASGIIEILCATVFLIPVTRRIGFFLCVAFIGGIITANWIQKSFNLGLVMQTLLFTGMFFEDPALFKIPGFPFLSTAERNTSEAQE